MRLIDADKINLLLGISDRDIYAKWMLDHMDTVDAVPVTRCKDCKYWADEHGKAQRADGVLYARCRIHNHEVGDRNVGWVPTEDDFCSYGERKENKKCQG